AAARRPGHGDNLGAADHLCEVLAQAIAAAEVAAVLLKELAEPHIRAVVAGDYIAGAPGLGAHASGRVLPLPARQAGRRVGYVRSRRLRRRTCTDPEPGFLFFGQQVVPV